MAETERLMGDSHSMDTPHQPALWHAYLSGNDTHSELLDTL